MAHLYTSCSDCCKLSFNHKRRDILKTWRTFIRPVLTAVSCLLTTRSVPFSKHGALIYVLSWQNYMTPISNRVYSEGEKKDPILNSDFIQWCWQIAKRTQPYPKVLQKLVFLLFSNLLDDGMCSFVIGRVAWYLWLLKYSFNWKCNYWSLTYQQSKSTVKCMQSFAPIVRFGCRSFVLLVYCKRWK